MKHILRILFGLLLLIPNRVYTQDIENQIATLRDRWQNPIRINGALSTQISLNSISGLEARRDPFSFNVFGSAAFDVFGIKAPFSIAIADRNTTYNLPSYSFVGISPSYKWAKLHLFRRSMQFSEYTLSGQGFNGLGLELTPGKWKISAMLGDLRKARLQDFGLRQNLDPIYQRKAWSTRIAYENEADQIGLTIFKATDVANSVPGFDSLDIRPQENAVINVEGRKRINDFLSVSGSYALSMHNQDNRIEGDRSLNGVESLYDLFMDVSSQSALSKAFNFSIDFSPSIGDISIAYERVDPRFVSLGRLNFQNDFENWTIGYRGKIKKYSISARLGVERNNLALREAEERNRFVGMLQLGIPISERWNNNFNYSNFRQTTRLRDRTNPLELVDSIFLGNTNHQVGWSTSYSINPDMSIQGNISIQNANSVNQEQVTGNSSQVNNYSISYNYTPQKSKMQAVFMFMINRLKNDLILSQNYSPAIRFTYKLNEQWNTQALLNYNRSNMNNMPNGNVWRSSITSNYSLKDKHAINFNFQYINRQGAIMQNFNEIQVSLGYNYQFAFFNKK